MMEGVLYSMGAGNWLPCKRDMLLDWEGFYVSYEGIYGDRYIEEGVYDSGEIDGFIDTIEYELTSRFPSLKLSDEWRRSDEKVHLDDGGVIQLVIGENNVSAAVYFVFKDPNYLDYLNDTELGYYSNKFGDYVDGLKDILTTIYEGNVYIRNDAWMSTKL